MFFWSTVRIKKISNKYSIFVFFLVLVIHFSPALALFIPFQIYDLYLFFISYSIRVFCLTAGYHRYFSHKSFSTSRLFQFFLAYFAACSLQGGPLWWASHHRHHHHVSDQQNDVHSPAQHGFWQSHFLWFMQRSNLKANYGLIKDFSCYPELRFLERWWLLTPVPIISLLYCFFGLSGIIWGFVVPTVFVNNATYCVNSILHLFGSRRYLTKEDSRNNFWIALITFGEGWHNNHHRYAGSVRQGFSWYQVDITFYILFILSKFRIVNDLKAIPDKVLAEGGYV